MEYFESSIFVRYLKKIGQDYLTMEKKIGSVYLSSFTHRLIRKTIEAIKIGFKYSIFGRLTEIDDDASRNFFETSRTTKILLNWIRNLKNKAMGFSTTSSFVISSKDMKHTFILRPLKVGGIIIITTIMTNLFLSIILQKQITLWGWLMRVLFLFIGISGLFCDATWEDIKKTSAVFQLIYQKQSLNMQEKL